MGLMVCGEADEADDGVCLRLGIDRDSVYIEVKWMRSGDAISRSTGSISELAWRYIYLGPGGLVKDHT